MFVLPDRIAQAVLANIEFGPTSPMFPGGNIHLHLYTNDVLPTPESVLGDFVEATAINFPGYVPGIGSWQGFAGRNQRGDWYDWCFTVTGWLTNSIPPAPLAIYGVYLTNGAGTVLLGAQRFDETFVIQHNNDAVQVLSYILLTIIDDGSLALSIIFSPIITPEAE